MAGSLGFGRQYCIPKGKASAECRFLQAVKALCRAERWKGGLVRSGPLAVVGAPLPHFRGLFRELAGNLSRRHSTDKLSCHREPKINNGA